jgi:hypothetical protein
MHIIKRPVVCCTFLDASYEWYRGKQIILGYARPYENAGNHSSNLNYGTSYFLTFRLRHAPID